jgi:hypothetical protein
MPDLAWGTLLILLMIGAGTGLRRHGQRQHLADWRRYTDRWRDT